MRRPYSRLAKTEENKNIRSAYLYVVLSVVGLVLFVFLGIPTMSKILGVIGNFKGDSPIVQKDSTPPAPPQIDTPPEATNDMTLELTGSTESGVTVLVTLNGQTTEVIADSEGNFTTKVQLLAGENTLYLQAKDNSGNESGKTQVYKIIQDATKPKIDNVSPTDGSHFTGDQKQQNIQGKTDVDATVRVNDKPTHVNEDGTFSFAVSLSDGENSFVIIATDRAQNTTETTVKLYYSP